MDVAEQTPSSVTWNPGPGFSSRVRPTSCSSAAPSRRSERSRGWSCTSSRQIVATPDGVLEQAARVDVMRLR